MSHYRPAVPRFTAPSILALVAAGTAPTMPKRMHTSERREVADAMQRLMDERDICAVPAGRLLGLRSSGVARAIATAYNVTASPSARASARVATLIAAGRVSAEAIAAAHDARLARLAALYDKLRPQAVAMRAAGASLAEIAAALGTCRTVITRLIPQEMRRLPKIAKRKLARKASRAAPPPKPPAAKKARAPRRLPAAPPIDTYCAPKAPPNPRLSPAQQANIAQQRRICGGAWRFDSRTKRLAKAPPLTRAQEDALIAQALAARGIASTTLGEGTTAT